MKKIIIVILTLILLSGCIDKNLNIYGDYFEEISFDKNQYNPADEVEITISFYENLNNENYDLQIEIYKINELIISDEIEIDSNIIKYRWVAPLEDFTGYYGKVSLYDGNNIIDVKSFGLDVSSNWSFNPRYGYLSKYNNLDENEISEILNELSKYRINGLQFYDWQYKHNVPYDSNLSTWYEISNKLVDSEIIDLYINEAHSRNVKTMNYNLIFGAYDGFENDGVSIEWGLYKDSSHNTLDYHPLPSLWATSKLYLMDPNNINWRQYILEKEMEVFNRFDFDGWHMDQLGNRGYTFAYDGTRVDLQDSYSDFINYMSDELNKSIVFNIVNNYGMLDILNNNNIDFVYTELWDNYTYNELANTIKIYRNISNKSVVVAAYMNYDLSDTAGYFNTPAIILTNSTIFSYGGTHIELGDHGMLGNEYFPNDNLKMTDELKNILQEYYNFQVAYENLLVGDIDYLSNKVVIDDYEYSNNGLPDSIWYHSTDTGDYEVLHLINLLQNSNDWRDNSGLKNTPIVINDLKIKYYTDNFIKEALLASPDYKNGQTDKINFSVKSDSFGQYYEFDVKYLKYWDMIILKK